MASEGEDEGGELMLYLPRMESDQIVQRGRSACKEDGGRYRNLYIYTSCIMVKLLGLSR